ncbi:hypothetical protein BE18_41120 [Sorangium cellulosum]|uniref:PDZ domain-containing protein n=1 Tax=Sorangium cellulosum TaxID=56 RepID=A0A150RRS6_SORCE|nr:hypothetical protein BE18_41120 [Sorangium cellulosum]
MPALAGSQAYAFLEARGGGARRPGMAEAEANRYLKQVGAFATPERVDARFQERDGAVMAVARYRMRKESFDAAVQSYRRTASAFGMTAAPVFPLLEGELKTSGDAVVVAVDERSPAQAAGVRVGDVVVAVNGRPLANFDALHYSLSNLPEGAAVELTVESGGPRSSSRSSRAARGGRSRSRARAGRGRAAEWPLRRAPQWRRGESAAARRIGGGAGVKCRRSAAAEPLPALRGGGVALWRR